MPLPLIPVLWGTAALATAVFGAKKGYDAYSDTKEAEKYHNKAKELYSETESKLNSARESAQDNFEKLGELKSDIVKNEFVRYREIVRTLNIRNDADFASIVGQETMNRLEKVTQAITSLETSLSAVAGSAAAGAMAGFGAFGAAGLLASASTGTAISSLSGVAATNATLAWFGGGSLAAGGLGMAGGTLVLGGIVVAPVIAVAASVFAASAEKKKYNACAYYDSVKALCEAMRGEAMVYKEILRKSEERIVVLNSSREIIQEYLTNVENIMRSKGFGSIWNKIKRFFELLGIMKDNTRVRYWSKEEQDKLLRLTEFTEGKEDAKSNKKTEGFIETVMNKPILNDTDPLTIKLKNCQEKCQELMDEIQRKWGQS